MAFRGVYCSASDLNLPLQSGVLSNPGRPVSVDASLDLLVLDMHGLATDHPVELRAEGIDGAMPGGLTAGTTYYAIALSQSRFQLAATAGGVAIDITSTGENVLASFPVPVDAAIQWSSRVLDENMPMHVVPFPDGEVPETVRLACAQLTAAYLTNRGGTQSAALAEAVKSAVEMVARWAKHAPVRGAGSPAGLATGAASAGESSRACAWRRYGGL